MAVIDTYCRHCATIGYYIDLSVPIAHGTVNNDYFCSSNSSIIPTEPRLADISFTLRGLTESDHIVITTVLSDRCGVEHPTIVVFEIRDSNGVKTVFLGLQNFTIKANSQTQVALSWVPRQA